MPLLRYLGWPILTGLLAAAVIVLAFPRILHQYPTAPVTTDAQQADSATAAAPQGPASYARAVHQAAPAVVNIYTRKILSQKRHALLEDPFFRRFFDNSTPPRQQRMESSLGSGVVMNDNGFILTNSHVVADADEIIVLLSDGREAEATIVGLDPETDLAVLKINLGNLRPITMGDPQNAQVGDVVLAIGNPFGVGQSVSQGIISATGRYGFGLNTYENFLQTDAAINPGNSGGALVDVKGQLLGINSAILDQTSSVGISFAIPANIAMEVLQEIVAHGRVIRGWLGVDTQQITPDSAARLGIDPPAALLITNVYVDSPAHEAGLQPGDVITRINGQIVSDGLREMRLIAELKPGDPLSLDLIRNDHRFSINTVAGTRPAASLVN